MTTIARTARTIPDPPTRSHSTPDLLTVAPEHGAVPAEITIIDTLWSNPIDDLPAVLVDLPDGRRMARRVIPGGHQKAVQLFWLVDRDHPARRPEPLNAYEDPLARPHAMLDQLRGVSPGGRPGLIDRSPLEIEVDAFAKTYPNIAHHLNLTRLAPRRLFDPGPCYRPQVGPNPPKYDPALTGEIDFAKFRDLHSSGDAGVHGKLADAPPLDPVTLWTIGLAPVLTRNAEALQGRLGAIRSDYEFTGPQYHKVIVTALTAMLKDERQNFTVFTVATSARPVESSAR